jgi:hypothetical protein
MQNDKKICVLFYAIRLFVLLARELISFVGQLVAQSHAHFFLKPIE